MCDIHIEILIIIFYQKRMQQIGKGSILIIQSSQTFLTNFYSHSLIISLIQNPIKFSEIFINFDTRTIKQLY